MNISNKILSLSGAGVSPNPGDATVTIEPQLVPVFSPRGPMAAIITTPPSGTGSIGESHLAYGQFSQGASQAIVDTVLTRLSAGLWHLNLFYGSHKSLASDVAANAAGNAAGIMLRRDAATGSVSLLPAPLTLIGSFRSEFTINLPSDGWEIRFRAPATIAADSAFVLASCFASRLS